MNWLRHAFATGPATSTELSPEERDWLERFCQGVVRRRLTPAVLTALEMFRPMSGLAAQGLYFFAPLFSLFVSMEQVGRLAAFLQRSDAVAILCQRLEAIEAEAGSRENRNECSSTGLSDPTVFPEADSAKTDEPTSRLSVE